MMVGVDQSRQHDMRTGVKDCSVRGGRLGSLGYQFDDLAALDHDAAFGAVGENSEGIPDPDRRCWLHVLLSLLPATLAALQFKDQPAPAGSWRWSCKTS